MIFPSVYVSVCVCWQWQASQSSDDNKFDTVMDSLVKFRSDVRRYALSPNTPLAGMCVFVCVCVEMNNGST